MGGPWEKIGCLFIPAPMLDAVMLAKDCCMQHPYSPDVFVLLSRDSAELSCYNLFAVGSPRSTVTLTERGK